MSHLAFKDVSLIVRQQGRIKNIFDGINFEIPNKRLVVVSATRATSVGFFDILCRKALPQKGSIKFSGSVSWVIGQSAPFFVTVTGTQAVTHFCTIYGIDRRLLLDFLQQEFIYWPELHRPIQEWPRAAQSQFMLLMSLAPDFDIYLVDMNFVFPDDPPFSSRFLHLFNHRTQGKTVLMMVRQARFIKVFCEAALVVSREKFELMHDLDAAIKLNNNTPNMPVAIAESEEIEDETLF